MEAPTETWLTRDETAGLIKVSTKTLAQWAWLETGPKFYKVGRYCRYKASDVAAWMESQPTGGQRCA